MQFIKSLSCLVFIIDWILSNQTWQFKFIFDVEWTYTIGNVIVLSCFYHIPHTIRSDLIVQYHIQWISHLYDRSHRCFVYFLWYITSYPINYDFRVDNTCKINHIVVLSSIRYRRYLVQSVTLLSCLVLLINHTLSNWSWQFSAVFYIEHTCMTGHVIVLSGFRDKLLLLWSIMIV